MKYIILLFLILSIGCAPSLDRAELAKLPIFESPEFAIQFSMDLGVSQDPEFWGAYLDDQLTRYDNCVQTELGFDSIFKDNDLLDWRVVLVNDLFPCFHDSNSICGGAEFSDERVIVVASYRELEIREFELCDRTTISLCHELSHACSGNNVNSVCLESDHSNQVDLKECLSIFD